MLKDKIQKQIKLIAFDADDTLWSNEPLFRTAEKKMSSLLSQYGTHDFIASELYQIEVQNMADYGFGAMAFTLSLLETAIKISHHQLNASQTEQILKIGRELLHNPAKPLDGVTETLEALHSDGRYRLLLLTKGELLTQENKIQRSGLAHYFDAVDIVSDKNREEYLKICQKYGLSPKEIMMVGNSFKSDIAPVLEIGGIGVHIPAESLWQLEQTEEYEHENLIHISNLRELLSLCI